MKTLPPPQNKSTKTSQSFGNKEYNSLNYGYLEPVQLNGDFKNGLY